MSPERSEPRPQDAARGSGGGKLSLPHDPAAEKATIGAMLVDCEAASGVFKILTHGDFYSPRHAKIFKALRRLHDQPSTVDELLLADELERCGDAEEVGGLAYLEDLIERLPIATNAEQYASIVREKAQRRQLLECFSKGIQRVRDAPADMAQEIAAEATAKLAEIETTAASEQDDIFEPEFFNDPDVEPDIPLPEWWCDDLLAPGYVTASGKWKSGKTWLMLAIAQHVALGRAFLGRKIREGNPAWLQLDMPRDLFFEYASDGHLIYCPSQLNQGHTFEDHPRTGWQFFGKVVTDPYWGAPYVCAVQAGFFNRPSQRVVERPLAICGDLWYWVHSRTVHLQEGVNNAYTDGATIWFARADPNHTWWMNRANGDEWQILEIWDYLDEQR